MNFLRKTFGGVTRAFYWRQFLIGLIFFIPLVYQFFYLHQKFEEINQKGAPTFIMIFIFGVMQFLFPYAKFVYHSVTDFLMGNNVLIVNTFIMIIYKLMVALFCWIFSPIIAPIGLIYLYFYHSKK